MLPICFNCRLTHLLKEQDIVKYTGILLKNNYVNDETGVGNIAYKSDESTGLLIAKVLNENCTRQGKMFDVIVVIFLCGLNNFV